MGNCGLSGRNGGGCKARPLVCAPRMVAAVRLDGCLLLVWLGLIADRWLSVQSSRVDDDCAAIAVVGKAQPCRKGQSRKWSNSKKATVFVAQGNGDDFGGLVNGGNGVESSR